MWATAGSLDEFVVRAEAAWTGGVEFAEVRVMPGPLQLRAPGSDPVDCPDSGTAYNTSLPDGQQDTDCYLTFTRSSARQAGGTTLVTASTVWTASWTGTGAGSPQVLPSTPASSSFPLPVAEVQSVVVSG